MTRGHKAALDKPYFRLNKSKFSFLDYNHLSHDLVNASSVNVVKNKMDNYLARAYLGVHT